jgi:Domain of unknown function (DUF4190)
MPELIPPARHYNREVPRLRVLRLKPCPYCSSQIENDALQCPYCQRWLDPKFDATLNADSPPIVLPPRTTSGLAIASLVCAVFAWGPGSIAGIILGFLALRQIRRQPLRIRGRRMAIAGIVLGCVGILVLAGLLSLGRYFWRNFQEQPQPPHSEQVHYTTASVSRARFAEQVIMHSLGAPTLSGGYHPRRRIG